jgi:SAM-dependent methyltransferase
LDVPNRWDAGASDGAHSFVFEYGSDVVSLLDPQDGERILDLGCGTGHLTDEIAAAGAEVVGADVSGAMLRTARENYPDRRFVRADARALAFEGAFDAVFSNAALHWIDRDEQDRTLESVATALKPGGRFVAELGGTGNVGAIAGAVRSELERRGFDPDEPWYFPSVGEYASLLETHGFEVRYARLFDRPTELEDGEDGLATWLDMFGDGLLGPLSAEEQREVVAAVEDELRGEYFEDGVWTADYRRLRFFAVRMDER